MAWLNELALAEDEELRLERKWEMEDPLFCSWTFDQNVPSFLPNSALIEASLMSSPFEPYPDNHSLSTLQTVDCSSYNTLDNARFAVHQDFLISANDDKEEPRNGSNKLAGQQSKNLMAERRRRKRLNDRLSMLRSIVPKISKMDRTAILGDAIDYTKELAAKINCLQQEIEMDSEHRGLQMSIFKDVKPNEFLPRNPPEFDVVRRKEDTRIEIVCGSEYGMLLSTVTAIEELGLEIQHCAISCFNGFTMRASCSEELELGGLISPDEIKQALLQNSGYGGRNL